MNKEWSDKNKKMQALISKEATFAEGISVLIDLRSDLFSQVSFIVNNYPEDDMGEAIVRERLLMA